MTYQINELKEWLPNTFDSKLRISYELAGVGENYIDRSIGRFRLELYDYIYRPAWRIAEVIKEKNYIFRT
jgi:hypothetical protein